MTWAWVMGMIILSGVPAIIGGGITYYLAGSSWTAVVVWEVALVLVMGFIIARGAMKKADSHAAH